MGGCAVSLLARLIEAGTPADLVAEVARELARAEVAQEAIQTRRERDRERQQRRRGNVTSRDSADVTVAPPLSRPPNENISNPPTHTPPDNTPRPRKGTPAKPDGVQDQTWGDFCKLRERKRSPLTATALTGIRREAEKAGWPLEAALAEAVTRGWQSFKADWIEDRKNERGQVNRASSAIGAGGRSSLARAIDEGLGFLGP